MARPRNLISSIEDIHVYSINVKERIIYLGAEFEAEESGIDFRMAMRFIKNLDHLSSLSEDPITVKICSYGGCWNYGMAIYDSIIKSPCVITVQSFAHARSMSSIIPQAADVRQISKHADFMVHYGEYGDSGDFRKVINGMKFYDLSNHEMMDIYTKACINGKFASENNMSYTDLYKYIENQINTKVDWWLSAEEAVYYGFMDEVI